MFKLALNAGHGYETPGKRCLKSIDPNETREYALNKRIADLVQSKLSAYGGIEVIRIDNGTDIAISNRAKTANSKNADFYLAVHHNAGINGGAGGGTECYVYLKVDEQTKAWQQEIYNCFIESTGLKGNRAQPLRSADFGECRETKMPAVLIECGFMDSTVDTPVILTEDFAQKAANGLVKAIVKRANLGEVKEENSVPASAQPVQGKTVEELANEVIAGKWANGEARKINLNNAGYDYSAVQKRVNEILKGGNANSGKSVETLADEVIKGLWGNNPERKERLLAAGYDYSAIQKRVNEKLR